MNDVIPPKRPQQQQVPKPLAKVPPITPKRPLGMDVRSTQKAIEAPTPEPLLEKVENPLLLDKPKKSKKKIIWWSVGIILAVLAVLAAGAYVWYKSALEPVSSAKTEAIQVEIADGSSPAQIGQLLEEKKIIRSSIAFDIYTRIYDVRSKLQAGVYALSSSDSMPTIVTHLTSGNVDEFSITFLPGATLAENREALIKAGYGATEVDVALKKTYTSPLFADKPESADLEGYIYGETYRFSSGTTVQEVLQATFDEFYDVIAEKNLIEEFKRHDLNLYQAITLASIIQREVPGAADQKQVAQVFYTRLGMDMELGSDVTYQYAAKKLGVNPNPDLDSPYNTRRFKGLPPGPIAAPGLTALEAGAHPADGDYVYFLSGDDDVTYFAKTSEEHEKNITDHCQVKCSSF
jgi:UPF0755 protein